MQLTHFLELFTERSHLTLALDHRHLLFIRIYYSFVSIIQLLILLLA